MLIAIVGAGRLGRSLAALLAQAGRDVRLFERGDPVPPSAGVVLLCVPDSSVAEVARGVPTGPVVLHCAGALGIDVLRPHRPAGSLHPLMTFPGPELGLPDLAGVPAAVDGDPQACRVAEELAAALGLTPFRVPGDRRLYHAAAVLAGSARVLLAEAARALTEAGTDPACAAARLAPLMHAAIDNLVVHGSKATTGPASRRDTATTEAHRKALEDHGLSEVRAVYDALVAPAEPQTEPPPTSDPDGT